MNKPTLLLVDNGSTRPAATMNLRRLARQLEKRVESTVHPVSLQHADKIPPEQLEGHAAMIFPSFLRNQLLAGNREFVVLPLFFGQSRALTSFIPGQVRMLTDEFGEFSLRVADVLVPLPHGEPALVALLRDNIYTAASEQLRTISHVILVDHGSRIPEVTAVRSYLAAQLRDALGGDVELHEAVMERCESREFDFNGPLLSETLADIAKTSPKNISVVLALLFLSPGRHAGPGGDIAEICRQANRAYPRLNVFTSPLVGDHPALIDILQTRMEKALSLA